LTLYSDKYIRRDTAAKQISVSCNSFLYDILLLDLSINHIETVNILT